MAAGPHLNILGTRGIPAGHGGFETFAEQLAVYLHARGWTVTVYCQVDEKTENLVAREDTWNGIQRVNISAGSGGVGTMLFDLRCVFDVLRRPGVDLVLGYNTALFNVLQRVAGRRVVMNMDGIEWKRAKWSLPAKIWFYVNEVIGSNSSSTSIADHPEIAKHLAERSFRGSTMIPYGAPVIDDAPADLIASRGVEADRYLVSIARIEPENSILEMVQAFSDRPRGLKMLILGKLDDANPYHRAVKEAAGAGVTFAGAIYDQSIVKALRFHARAYMHGHQVGGTNPSLVESLGAGNAVIAHDNRFNRWTAGAGQLYFSSVEQCSVAITRIETDMAFVGEARRLSRQRHAEDFRLSSVLGAYEAVLAPK